MKRLTDRLLMGLVAVLACVGVGLVVAGFGGAGASAPQPTATKGSLSTILKVSPIGTQPATEMPARSVPMTIQGVTAAPVQAAPDVPASGGYVCADGAACIKGNINSEGVKLYHLPVGCPSYKTTDIDKAGEQMFVSEADAIAAGWNKAGNCH